MALKPSLTLCMLCVSADFDRLWTTYRATENQRHPCEVLMSIYEQVNGELTAAMKNRDRDRATTLRGLRAAFIEEMKKDNSDSVNDEKAVGILRRLARQRGESIEAFENGGRPELAEAERAELAIIETFLPQLADEATTRGWVEAAIAETGAEGPGGVGKVMGYIMKNHKADVDGKLAKTIAEELLK